MYPIQPPPDVIGTAGSSLDHNQIKDNLVGLLASAPAGTACRALSSDMKVRTEASRSYSYPDVVVFCGAPCSPSRSGAT